MGAARGWQSWHQLFPSMTVMGIRPGLPSSAREEGGWEGGPLPSPDQGTEKSRHLGLQKKPLNGCFRVRTSGLILSCTPLVS